ncbi:MAG: dihydrodipicolinate reductase [Candidatus Binatia bacterium]|nr:dihydrodipicolinate reductase [Candidatus Binatia bacterium]
MKSYRVVQWGTGNVGGEALRSILDAPHLELAGVRVYTKEKHGVDAGTLLGRDPVGVAATTRIEDILATDADCVSYMPRIADLDDVCRLLESGKSVVATPFLFYAHALPAADRDRVERACAAGGSSVCGMGIHPGFVGMVLPLALSGAVRRVDRITVQERANWDFYDSPRITFDNMRFGRDPEDATLAANPFARFNSDLFQQQIHMLGAGLDAGLDEVTEEQILVTAEEGFDVAAGHIAAGTVRGQRYRWCGLAGGVRRIEIEALWTLGPDYPEGWPRPKDGWTITIEGEPSLRSHFISLASFERKDATIEEHVHSADIVTAVQAIHAIPSLCDAPPGIRSPLDLPAPRSTLGFGASTRSA